jgi:RsiW-degrading membrane proteinase PrsW (M82 family)
VLAIASVIFAVVPMLVYLWTVWMMDRYDREPLSLLLLNFVWGAIGAIGFGIVFSLLTSAALGTTAFLDTIAVAPVVEEIAKGAFLLWTARDRRFDNVTDGVVYGMAIGLGFGMTENFLYFLGAKTPDEWVTLVLVRTMFSAVMHAMATGIVGAFFGITKFHARGWRIPLRLLGLALAIGMHFSWNFAVSIDNPGAAGLGMLFIFLSLAIILALFQLSLYSENRLIVRELSGEAERGLIPATHLQYIPYTSKRKLIGWLSPAIDRKKYIQLATRLAFRLSQSRSTRDAERERFAGEIETLRTDIAALLAADRDSPAGTLY